MLVGTFNKDCAVMTAQVTAFSGHCDDCLTSNIKFHYFIYLFQLSFPTSYLVVCGVVFSYVLLDDVIVISFIAGLYFKMDKFVKVSD